VPWSMGAPAVADGEREPAVLATAEENVVDAAT
jgi:hypothetical protein